MPAFSVASVLSGRARHPIRRATGTEGRPLNRDQRRRVWRRLRDLRRPSARKGKGFQPTLKAARFAVAEALLNVFLNRRTGRLDPSLKTLAIKAGVSRATAARAVRQLEALGVLAVVRRFVMGRDADDVSRPRRTTNAYAFVVPANDAGAAPKPALPGRAGAPVQPRLPFESHPETVNHPRIISRGKAPPPPASAEGFTPALQAALARLSHRVADLRDA